MDTSWLRYNIKQTEPYNLKNKILKSKKEKPRNEHIEFSTDASLAFAFFSPDSKLNCFHFSSIAYDTRSVASGQSISGQ